MDLASSEPTACAWTASVYYTYSRDDLVVYAESPRTFAFQIQVEELSAPISFLYNASNDLASSVEALIKTEKMAMRWYDAIFSHVKDVVEAHCGSNCTRTNRQACMTITETVTNQSMHIPQASVHHEACICPAALGSTTVEHSEAVPAIETDTTRPDISKSFAVSRSMSFAYTVNLPQSTDGEIFALDKLFMEFASSRHSSTLASSIAQEAISACHLTAAEILHGSRLACACCTRRPRYNSLTSSITHWLSERLALPDDSAAPLSHSQQMVNLLYQQLEKWLSMWLFAGLDQTLLAWEAYLSNDHAVGCILAWLNDHSETGVDGENALGLWAWKTLFCGTSNTQDPADDIFMGAEFLETSPGFDPMHVDIEPETPATNATEGAAILDGESLGLQNNSELIFDFHHIGAGTENDPIHVDIELETPAPNATEGAAILEGESLGLQNNSELSFDFHHIGAGTGHALSTANANIFDAAGTPAGETSIDAAVAHAVQTTKTEIDDTGDEMLAEKVHQTTPNTVAIEIEMTSSTAGQTKRTSPRSRPRKVLQYNQKQHPQDRELGIIPRTRNAESRRRKLRGCRVDIS